MANISTIKVGDTSYGITATPTAHASATTIYGAATASNYGHVKLSDNYTSSAGAAASGIGASSAAVYNAYNTLNSNLTEKFISSDDVTLNNIFSNESLKFVIREYKNYLTVKIMCMANVTLNESTWTPLCRGLPTIDFHACLTVVNVTNSVRGQVKALYSPDGSIHLMSDLNVSYLEQNDLIIITGIIPKK